MHVISRKALVEFWKSRQADSKIAENDLSTWFKIASKADWPNFAALKQTFGSADKVGYCVVFDVGNNRYRLIGIVKHKSNGKGVLYVKKVMDHAEYDKKSWIHECGCSRPPKKKTTGVSGAVLKGKSPKSRPKEGR